MDYGYLVSRFTTNRVAIKAFIQAMNAKNTELSHQDEVNLDDWVDIVIRELDSFKRFQETFEREKNTKRVTFCKEAIRKLKDFHSQLKQIDEKNGNGERKINAQYPT
ncbi:hypothetical protein F5Y04DRAFT_284165 [Hypomontagnella monticulosa]|nr:hypothetical protein F5Y04DRAFT_284165 [Hypomontagnella monticulosa]